MLESIAQDRIRKLRGYLREMANSPVCLVHRVYIGVTAENVGRGPIIWKALKAILWNLDIFVLYMNLLKGSDIITAVRCLCGSGVHKRNLQYFFERNNTGSS